MWCPIQNETVTLGGHLSDSLTPVCHTDLEETDLAEEGSEERTDS